MEYKVIREYILAETKMYGTVTWVQTALIEQNCRKSLFKLEKRLDRELQDILNQEELYWRQQARSKWNMHGERNTKFFHACAKSKWRKHVILQLKD